MAGPRIELHPPPSAQRARPWSIEVHGTEVVTTTGKRRTERTFAGAWEAEMHAEREIRRKLMVGFHVHDADPPGHGGVVFLAGFRFGTSLFDLHPDGKSALVGQIHHDARAAEVVRIDLETGARETVWKVEERHQSFLHAVRFEPGGASAIVARNEETLRLDLATGQTSPLAGYRSMSMVDGPGVFNPHCAQPSCDARRERWLLFDGDEATVRSREGAVLFRRDGRHPTREIRRGVISPSGKRVALHVASRHVTYHHADAEGDTTNVVEIWDVDAGTLACEIPLGGRVEPAVMAISPSDAHLLATLWYGPSGVLVFDLAAPDREPVPLPLPLADGYAFDLAFSRDGALLAAGGSWRAAVVVWPAGLVLLDARERARRVEKVCFSDDGTLLASGGPSGELCVRRLPR